MNQFESVKAAVPLRQAAETYGLSVSRNGMTCCPFHEDRHPSMKLNEDYFFCFGCGASGDVIDFTARLFGIDLKTPQKNLPLILASRRKQSRFLSGRIHPGWKNCVAAGR